ncbi:protein Allo60 [Cyprinid herpesvirus 3]|nr:unnamed protein product [Cyprinid herpesvirus 3]ABF81814.1 hypothetical protein [Cyprinid herpesvirus 3]ABG42907.1 protein Allo60 [Cyprinid herpesvirus 3]AJP55568.1 protein Allo60 [Cyprinid herpesvirus 3]AJP55723.1 protein Allo60 [Cyprinid herpesvirus 3]AOO32485.1 protein Allo60 [Cyprinid herpesvirus 3]
MDAPVFSSAALKCGNGELPRAVVEPGSRDVGITKNLSYLYPTSSLYRAKQRIPIKLEIDGLQQDVSERLAKILQGRIWTKPQLSTELLKQLPEACRDRAEDLADSAAEVLSHAAPFTVHSVRQALIRSLFYVRVGTLVDTLVKREFHSRRGPIVASLYRSYGWRPIDAGIAVTSRRPQGHRCRVCGDVSPAAFDGNHHGTELDGVATDAEGNFILVEIKTHGGATVSAALLNRYKTQTWIGECMFRHTFGLCCSSNVHSYIVFVSPSTYTIDSVIQVPAVPKRLHPRLFSVFPSLPNLCFVRRTQKPKRPAAAQRPAKTPGDRPARPSSSAGQTAAKQYPHRYYKRKTAA